MADKIKGFKSILKLLPYAKKIVGKVDDVVDGAWSYKTAAKSAKKEVKNAVKYAKKPGIVRRYGQELRAKPIRTTLKTIAFPVIAGGGYSVIKNMGGTDTVDTSTAGISSDTGYNPYAYIDEQEQIYKDGLAQMAAINAAPSTGTGGTGGTGSGSSGTGYTPAEYPGVGDQSGNITYVDNWALATMF